ncbi:MAG: hypothetical protein ABSF65_02195 [Candidatus Bathyarchaeia archaeon]|jgi:hypothetical protein
MRDLKSVIKDFAIEIIEYFGGQDVLDGGGNITFSIPQKSNGEAVILKIVFYVTPPKFELVTVMLNGVSKDQYCEHPEIQASIDRMNRSYKNKLGMAGITKEDLSKL